MQLTITPKTTSEEFVQKLEELSGQKVHLCIQCGTCSGSCPMSNYMDFSTRKVMHLAKLGLEELLSNLNTYWTCASCHTCTVRCVRGIDIAKVMETLRQMTLRTNHDFVDVSQVSAESLEDCPQIAMVAGFRKLTS